MTRRQWKTAFFTLCGAFVVLILIGLFLYRDDLYTYAQDPGEPFQTYVPPPAPDYSLAESWIMRPDPATDSYHAGGAADIFILTPTLYTGKEHWNAPIEQDKLRDSTAFLIAPNYVSPFQSLGRVYAPYTRHAALYAFLTNRDDARAAQSFAFKDAREAFAQFLSENPPERPIILIGYGQGGLHLARLIADDLPQSDRSRLVAAYILDHPVLNGQMPANLPPCEQAEQTGCIVAFTAFTDKEGAQAERFATHHLVFENGELGPVAGRSTLCVNPLLWTTATDYAPARLHQGGVAASGLTPDMDAAPSPRQFGAQCVDGLLLIDKPKRRALRRGSGFGDKVKTPGYNLFSEDLRLNMASRTAALIATGDIPRRAPSLQEIDIIDIDDAPITPDN